MNNLVGLLIARRGSGKSSAIASIASKARRVITIDPIGEHRKGYRCESLGELGRAMKRLRDPGTPGRYIYSPRDDAEAVAIVDASLSVPGVLLLIDEIDMFMAGALTQGPYVRLMRYGRHHGVGVIGATRRPYAVSPEVRSAVTHLVVGRLIEDRDIRFVEGMGAGLGDLRSLGQYEGYATDFFAEPQRIEIRDTADFFLT